MNITYTFEGNLYVNLTNRCPNNCEFCLRNNHDGVGTGENLWFETEPTKEEILEDILKNDLSSFPQLVFCGYGEPTCRLDDMLWICKKVKEQSNIMIRLNTNGLSDLINNKQTAKEFDNLIDIVSISLNASTKEKYDTLCHCKFGPDAYDSIIKFAKSISIYVPKVYMTVVDNHTSITELNACSKICKEIGAIFKVRPYIS